MADEQVKQEEKVEQKQEEKTENKPEKTETKQAEARKSVKTPKEFEKLVSELDKMSALEISKLAN